MRRTLTLAVMLLSLAQVVCAQGWDTFVAADGSFSLQYPAGWQVTEQPSAVVIESADGREIVLLSVPYRADESAREHAERMVALLKAGNAGLTAANWETSDDGAAVSCELSYVDDGTPYRSDAIVVKDDPGETTLWFSYSAPAAGYDQAAALETLRTVMTSLTADGTEPGPEVDLSALTPEERQIVNGFLFTVEFALGQPLDLQSEQLVARELVRGWQAGTSTPEDMSMYPALVQQIMSLEQAELDELQKDLHGVLVEWLNESAPNDLVVALLQERLQAAKQVVAEDEPALTAVAAQTYAEMFAMAETLYRSPEATVADIPGEVVTDIREQLVAEWPQFGAEQRAQVLSAPGVWGVLRHALLLGGGEQPQQARTILVGLLDIPEPQEVAQGAQAGGGAAAPAGGGEDGEMTEEELRDEMTRNYVYGETLRQMQQHTFNTWRWSMGYCRGPMGF